MNKEPEWKKFGKDAAEDYTKWANRAYWIEHHGPSLALAIFARQAAEAMEKFAKLTMGVR